MNRVDQLCQEIYRTPPQSDRRTELLRMLADLSGLGAEESYRAAMALGAEADPGFVSRACELALTAWKGGYPNAGALYAHCVDRLCLVRQELPKFGVNRWEHDGDLMMPIIDGTVGDAERTALGLPSLAETQLELEVENRHRAEQRAAAPLPEGVQIRRIWRRWSPDQLLARGPVFMENDDLTFVYEGDADEVRLVGGLPMQLWRLPESMVWAASVRVRNLAEAVVSYGFVPKGEAWPGDQWPLLRQWRGPKAPPPPHRPRYLAGQVLQDQVDSPAMGETRGLAVYVPPDHDPEMPTPVVYAADGQMVPALASVLDPLIAAGKVPKVLLVGVCNAGVASHDQRTREYVPGQDPERFAAHERFFMEEVTYWAEVALGASSDPNQRAVLGCSSGANFALEMGQRHAGLFGNVFAFSVGGRTVTPPLWEGGAPPRHYLVAGTLETGFAHRTRTWAAWLQAMGVEHRLEERVFGHDTTLWEEALPAAILWAFDRPEPN